MKKFFLGSFGAVLALCAVNVAQASFIPPHVDVVTHCGSVSSVFVHFAKGERVEYNLDNTKPADLDALASKAPRASWVDGGCSQ